MRLHYFCILLAMHKNSCFPTNSSIAYTVKLWNFSQCDWKEISQCSFNWNLSEGEHLCIFLIAVFISFFVNLSLSIFQWDCFVWGFNSVFYKVLHIWEILELCVMLQIFSPSLWFVFAYGFYHSEVLKIFM